MKLIKLVLDHFKGLRGFTMDLPQGESARISGRNGLGKTTLMDAYFWLLSGKDSRGRNDSGASRFNPMTRGATGHDCSVEGSFLLDGGKTVTLRRVYREVFSRASGETETKKTGSTTDYYIDGVQKSKGEYNRILSDICDERILLALSDPDMLAGKMKPDERREILFKLFAEQIDSAATIAKHAELQELPQYLQGRSVDEYMEWAKGRKAAVSKRLNEIPIRISATEQAKPKDGPLPDDGPALGRLTRQKLSLETELRALQNGEMAAAARKAVADLEARLSEAKAQYSRKFLNANTLLEADAAKLRGEIAALQSGIRKHRENIDGWTEFITNGTAEIKALRQKWEEESAGEFDASDNICPTCGQPYPAEQMEAARARFNETKASRIEAVEEKGRELSELQQNAEMKLEQEKTDLQVKEAQLQEKQKRIESLEKSYITPPPFEESEEYRSIAEKLATAQKDLQDFKSGVEQKEADFRQELEQVEIQIAAIRARIARKDQIVQCDTTIAELREEQKKCGVELAELERGLMLADKFLHAQSLDIEEQINSKFRFVRWKLFDVQMNGGIRPCCEAMAANEEGQWIEYGPNLNDGARINAGLDIIGAISRETGCTAPVWIDRAGEVTDYKADLNGLQIIRLFAKKYAAVLKVEVNHE